MITYQDYLTVGDSDIERMDFVRTVINQHKQSDLYKNSVVALDYFKVKNTTITNYIKPLTTATGRIAEDKWSPNHKVASGFFKRFAIQQNQFLLGNGITWGKEETDKKLGKRFETRLQEIGEEAIIGAVAFGFWNLDHIEVFTVREFAPILDEENGSLRMGVRFWQIDASKPLRATLYEEDGYTEYIWNTREGAATGEVLKDKQKYIKVRTKNEAEGELSEGDRNYKGFPIIPMWANKQHESELLCVRDAIDAYDLIKNGFENELDSAQIYWLIKGAGGMDNQDLVQFLDRLLTNRIASVEGDQDIQAHEIHIPYEARERLLKIIEQDLYRDYMALNTDEIKSGAVVTSQIKAAYEGMNAKADKYEYQVHEFLDNLLDIVGIEDEATFTRSMLINGAEIISMLIQAAEYLSREYVTEKILTVLGDGDRVEEVLRQMDKEELALSGMGKEEDEDDEDNDNDREDTDTQRDMRGTE